MDHLTTGAMRRPEKVVEEPLVIPPPSLPARTLSAEEIEHPDFPVRAARTAYRKACEAGMEAILVYSIGPWMSADFTKILEHDCHTIALRAVRSDRQALHALWIRRGEKWSFQEARSTDQGTLNSKEMTAWLST